MVTLLQRFIAWRGTKSISTFYCIGKPNDDLKQEIIKIKQFKNSGKLIKGRI